MAISKSTSFLSLMQTIISRKSALGKAGTAQNYHAALNSFRLFLPNPDILPSLITPSLLACYQAWLADRGLAPNSISFYMRILRCVYNHAVDSGLTPDRQPFGEVYTGIAKTRKRAIPVADMKNIVSLDLAAAPALQRARDLFLLSFYCMGISFVDLATLKKGDIADGRLTYRRAKTGQTISVSLNPKMEAMFQRYSAAQDSPYLLDIVRDPRGDVRRQYQTELNVLNRNLKKVGALAGLRTALTTYVSRHSWASIAHSHDVQIGVISDALGHHNEATTRIYLASIDTRRIDHANALILSALDEES